MTWLAKHWWLGFSLCICMLCGRHFGYAKAVRECAAEQQPVAKDAAVEELAAKLVKELMK